MVLLQRLDLVAAQAMVHLPPISDADLNSVIYLLVVYVLLAAPRVLNQASELSKMGEIRIHIYAARERHGVGQPRGFFVRGATGTGAGR